MLVIYPFSIPDQEQALKNAEWIKELGRNEGHAIFVLADRRCDADITNRITAAFKEVFPLVQLRMTKSDIDGWPEGANHMFGYATALIQHTKEWPAFLWLEPDAIPMCTGWLDKLETEYRRGGKPFMGERVDLGEKRPDVPIHMSGVGIYQNPIYLLAGEAYRAHDVAWDIAAKDQILPHAHFTKLIQHYWKHGTFVSLDGIRPETVVFHSSKDGSLIDILRDSSTQSVRQIGERSAVQVGSPAPNGLSGREVGAPGSGDAGSSPVQAIKILPTGTWVLENDLISGQVIETGRLDFDPLIPHILKLIRPGDTVVDAGAFIGDHTIAYSHAVGKTGKVLAYEPNPTAFQCLAHNTDRCGNVFTFCHALGATREMVELTDLPNAASNYIGAGGRHVHVRPLDEDASLFGQIDLMKIDVEGYELNVLKGAEALIEKFHPKLVIEVNEIALKRQDVDFSDIHQWLKDHGYEHGVLHRHGPDVPFYDILCLPAAKPPEILGSAPAHSHPPQETTQTASAPPVVPTVREEIEWHIGVLKTFCESDPQTKAIVMQKLVYSGLRLPNKKKKNAKPKTTKWPDG